MKKYDIPVLCALFYRCLHVHLARMIHNKEPISIYALPPFIFSHPFFAILVSNTTRS